jgi:hypothetical protein
VSWMALDRPGDVGKSPGKWLDIRQLTDVSACKLQQYLSRNWHFHSAIRRRERSKLMASDRPVPYGIGSDTWPGLSRLAADAAQVARAARTIISTGNDTDQDAAVQRERLQEQLGDLRAAIDYVVGKNALDWAAVNQRRDRKRSLYERGIDEDQPPSPGQRDDDAAGSPGPPPPGHGAGDNGRPAPHQHARPSRPAAWSGRRPRARAAD